MNYRQKFLDLLTVLANNPFIEVTQNHIGRNASADDETYKLIFEDFKITLTEKLLNFYYSMAGCKINWKCDLEKHQQIKKFRSEDVIIKSEIRIWGLADMLKFDNKLEAEWWIANLDSEERKDLYNFRSFDFNDDFIRIGFIIKDKKIRDDKMYFIVQETSGFSPTGLSFEQYLDKIIEYKGFQGWQYNYFFQNTENYKRMMFYLDQLF